jgi:hypothetical protein
MMRMRRVVVRMRVKVRRGGRRSRVRGVVWVEEGYWLSRVAVMFECRFCGS